MIQFTIEDLQKLIQACDIATKAGGLQVAQEVLPLVGKMQQMAKEIHESESALLGGAE